MDRGPRTLMECRKEHIGKMPLWKPLLQSLLCSRSVERLAQKMMMCEVFPSAFVLIILRWLQNRKKKWAIVVIDMITEHKWVLCFALQYSITSITESTNHAHNNTAASVTESTQIMHTTTLLHPWKRRKLTNHAHNKTVTSITESTNHAQKNTATSMTECTNHAHGIAVRYTFGRGFGSPCE